MDKPRVCIFTRVSTDQQSTARQLLELNKFCDSRGWEVVKVISNNVSGASKDRKDLEALLECVARKEFDKILVSEISRLGRVKRVIQNILNNCHDNGISICFYSHGGIESLDKDGKETFISGILISVYTELAVEERRILIERTNSGLRNAVAKGVKLGRKKGIIEKINPVDKYAALAKDLRKGLSLQECVKRHKVSKNTVIKIKKLL